MKSFRPKGQNDADNNGWGDFEGQRRSNDTHESKTDPEARLLRKGRGREAKLCFTGHALMDNRNGQLVDLRVSQADGDAERNVAGTGTGTGTGSSPFLKGLLETLLGGCRRSRG